MGGKVRRREGGKRRQRASERLTASGVQCVGTGIRSIVVIRASA